jgi:cytochrome c biogenesis protein CcdA
MLELSAIPLAFIAGVFSVISPCVWPLVPVVTSSAAVSGRAGPVYLALGLSVAFAAAGTVLSFLLVATGTDPEFFRYIAAALLIVIACVLLIPALNDRATIWLSGVTGRFVNRPGAANPGMAASGATAGAGAGDGPGGGRRSGAWGQFGVGALLGIVWLPCVGPTLGAAIALASMGQSLVTAFIVMLAYGIGTAGVLLLAGLGSGKLLTRWKPRLMTAGGAGKKLLGWSLLVLGLLVLTGLDKAIETRAVGLVPGWVYTL